MPNTHETVEQPICARLVSAALKSGFSISVYDGEAWPLKRSTDKAAILAAMYSTDQDTLRIRNADGERIGDIALIYGNGADVISDYTDSLGINALVEPVQAYADSL